MKIWRIFPVLILLIIFTSIPLHSSAQDETPMYKVVAYYASWDIYGVRYFANHIPADRLTHINYAFFNISPEGECVLGDEWADTQYVYPGDTEDQALKGNFHQLHLLRDANPQLKLMMSVGGWSWSGRFSDVALTEESRQHFVESCVAMMMQYGFDGIDLDWEYPGGGGMPGNVERPEDPANFTLLLAEFRAQLDAQGDYLLTMAGPAGQAMIQALQLDQIHPYLDWINVMAYDFYGAWSSTTGFHAALYPNPDDPGSQTANASTAVQQYLDGGVPSEKIVLGAPLYGHGWANVPETNHGLWNSFNGVPDTSSGEGTYVYGLIANLDGYERYWDDTAQAAWLYNPTTQVMISYEDPQALQAKAAYVRELGLGGMMFWELSHDDRDNTLVNTIWESLNGGE
jgi:chitinase